MAFDLLIADGIDLGPLPLKQRKARLPRLGERAEGWIALTNGIVGKQFAIAEFLKPPTLLQPGVQSSHPSTPKARC